MTQNMKLKLIEKINKTSFLKEDSYCIFYSEYHKTNLIGLISEISSFRIDVYNNISDIKYTVKRLSNSGIFLNQIVKPVIEEDIDVLIRNNIAIK